jgi:alanine dehydrogenase
LTNPSFQLGLPRLHKEDGERRDFLPDFVTTLARRGANIMLEEGYGSGMGLTPDDYLPASGSVVFASHEAVYRQPFVLVLRAPTEDECRWMQPGSLLISMLHYPTRPHRVAFLRQIGLEALSLDGIKDDNGRRLVENLRAVGWNGVRAAMQVLEETYPDPGLWAHDRPALRVTVLGAGAVGIHVVRAASRYGDETRWRELASQGVPGALVQVVEYDLSANEAFMRPLLSNTDLLIDATQRPDTTVPVIPNRWLGWLPRHAVLLDLSVDPYDCDGEVAHVKGIEGIPQGDLDQYHFAPDDPAYENLPECVDSTNRRHAVSCYSWPGIDPAACMRVYGHQLQPIMRILMERGGVSGIRPQGRYFERAIARALLSHGPD